MCTGKGHRHGALRIHEPVAIVLVDVQIIGNDLELVAGHSENVVVVNVHERARKVRTPRTSQLLICARSGQPSNQNCVRSQIDNHLRQPCLNSKRRVEMKIETLAVHAGHAIDPATGAVSPPHSSLHHI